MGKLLQRYSDALKTLAETHAIEAVELRKILSILDGFQVVADLPLMEAPEKTPGEQYADWLNGFDLDVEDEGSDLSSLEDPEAYIRFIRGEASN